MAVGDWHALDGGRYRFRETLHGPFVAARCVDCGGECYVVQLTGRINAHGLPEDTGSTVRPRCSTCGRRRWGAPVKLYADRPRVQPGVGFPSRVVPADLTGQAVRGGKATVTRGLVEEWAAGDPRMPSGARGVLAALGGRGRVAHTVALAPDGGLTETVGVHLPGRAVAFFVRRDVAASVTPRKVDLKRTKTGRRKVQRFDPIVRPARTDWPGSALVRQGGALRSMTVTKLVQMIRDGEI